MKRGEVWEVNLDPTIGAEIKECRPCVIVNSDALVRLPLRIVVPLTEWDVRFETASWHIALERTAENGLSKKSSADTFQVRSVSAAQLTRRLGRLSDSAMERIGMGLKNSLALD
ncbi:MAG: type II toxin-antitoxin system PemK/MazF family toxin [Chloroflexi bacterium]|nr:type II toxin-antitoxin system PemK/MazF family toxin [Chloroflexota bacterium]